MNHIFGKGGVGGVVGEIRGENVWKNLVKNRVKISRNFQTKVCRKCFENIFLMGQGQGSGGRVSELIWSRGAGTI